MQTFLPYPDFSLTARVLDQARLGKQRVECKQIFLALTEPSYGWKNHPATRMWRGHEGALTLYAWHICHEWRSRGFADTLMPWFEARMDEIPGSLFGLSFETPPWLGQTDFHLSHQSNLLRKDPGWYEQFYWDVPPDLPYVWPVEG